MGQQGYIEISTNVDIFLNLPSNLMICHVDYKWLEMMTIQKETGERFIYIYFSLKPSLSDDHVSVLGPIRIDKFPT